MTQIIAALTRDYVLVASDRRLTVVGGPRNGQVGDDDTCKLVSLCGIWGIAYTGLSRLQGAPTHEWIALRLAESSCRDPYAAAQILAREGARALKLAPLPLELTFLMAGWLRPSSSVLQPHFVLVSNMYDAQGKRRSVPGQDLHSFERKLKADEVYAGHVIGQGLLPGRGKHLGRFFRRVLKHRTTPKPAMEALVKEIIYTSTGRVGVGNRILAFSIPQAAAMRTYETGHHMMLAMQPDLRTTAFCYFDPADSQLRQHGPTFVYGDAAVTDVEGVDDPTRNFQSASFRILHMPKNGPLPALVLRAS